MLTVKVVNIYNPKHDVVFAALYLNPSASVYPPRGTPPKPDAKTGWQDVALKIDHLAAGTHTLWVVPKVTSDEPVGISTGATGTADRIYRGLAVRLTTAGVPSKVTAASVDSSTLDNGTVKFDPRQQHLAVEVRAVWMKSGRNEKWGRLDPIDMVMVHMTGGPRYESSMHTFLSGASPHYMVLRDGHVIKFALEALNSGHAAPETATGGATRWGMQKSLGKRSIGIENVGAPEDGMTDAQYRSLIPLIKDLMDRYKIPRHRVVGHSEVLTEGVGKEYHLSNMRVACPGWLFDWPRLEAQGIGLRRDGGTLPGGDPVGAFFDAMQAAGLPDLALAEKDYDGRQVGKQAVPGRFGGKDRVGVSDTPVAQLQTWLKEIGYSVGPVDGVFNPQTARAVLHFRVHFQNLKANVTPVVNRQTAALIRAVRAANPRAD